jgi:hypothetical protein
LPGMGGGRGGGGAGQRSVEGETAPKMNKNEKKKHQPQPSTRRQPPHLPQTTSSNPPATGLQQATAYTFKELEHASSCRGQGAGGQGAMPEALGGYKKPTATPKPAPPAHTQRTLPPSATTSLSMPRGPKVVRTASTTAWHALMLEINCPFPWDVSVPSRSRMICGRMPLNWGFICHRQGGKRGGRVTPPTRRTVATVSGSCGAHVQPVGVPHATPPHVTQQHSATCTARHHRVGRGSGEAPNPWCQTIFGDTNAQHNDEHSTRQSHVIAERGKG